MSELKNFEGDIIPENLAVITTKSVMNEKSLVQLVVRDIDGDWQFLPHVETLTEEDALVVAIKNIISIDSTLRKIMHLRKGERAWRGRINEEWSISVVESE